MVRRDPRDPPARRCTAHTSSGKPCGNYAIRGGTVCKTHGGSAPQVRAKAEETLAEWRARRALDLDKGLEPILSEKDGKRLTAMVAKNPALLPRLMELADRFRGGGVRAELTGPDGEPLKLFEVKGDWPEGEDGKSKRRGGK